MRACSLGGTGAWLRHNWLDCSHVRLLVLDHAVITSVEKSLDDLRRMMAFFRLFSHDSMVRLDCCIRFFSSVDHTFGKVSNRGLRGFAPAFSCASVFLYAMGVGIISVA